MNRDVIITCAVTGAADTVDKHPNIPVTPQQIADAAIEAAMAGAAVVHIHVRDPDTGQGSRDRALFREVVDRIRDSDTDAVINLTAGMGGDLYLGPPEDPMALGDLTDIASAEERVERFGQGREVAGHAFADRAGGDGVEEGGPITLIALAKYIVRHLLAFAYQINVEFGNVGEEA